MRTEEQIRVVAPLGKKRDSPSRKDQDGESSTPSVLAAIVEAARSLDGQLFVLLSREMTFDPSRLLFLVAVFVPRCYGGLNLERPLPGEIWQIRLNAGPRGDLR